MHPEFWDEKSIFHTLRYEFVYKICPRETPKRLKYKKESTIKKPN
jgi:putative two-component system hydrogenase maturation factor HypX/HoxX